MRAELRRALEAVARRARRLRLLSSLAACWLLFCFAGGILALTLKPDSLRPAVGYGLTAALAGLICAVLASRSHRNLRATALQVEARFPDLNAALLTAVEEDAVAGTKPFGYLQETVLSQVFEHRRTHDWGAAVSYRALRGMRWAQLIALLGVLSITGLLVAQSRSSADKAIASKLRRQASDVEVTPGDTEIERGTPLLVVARFGSRVPASAKLVVTDESKATHKDDMSRSLEDPTFAGRVESVMTNLTYRVSFGDETTPEYHVRVFEYPELVKTDAKLVYPEYTALEPRTAQDIRHVTAVEGTDLTLLCRLNKNVASARLVDEKGTEKALTPVEGESSTYSAEFPLTDSHRYKVRLVDSDGRENKFPPELAVNVTQNKPPAITILQPGHDMRVSPLEELHLKARVEDDFGVVRHGINFTLAGQEPRELVLSNETAPRPKKAELDHILAMEALAAAPDELLTYHLWAEDIGPDGKPRRTEGDLYFAEVRHFEEIFRQGEQPSSAEFESQQQNNQGNGQQAEQLAQLQKDIINGTWKILRRETKPPLSNTFVDDNKVLRESQESAIKQAEALEGRLRDPESKANLDRAVKAMQDAVQRLGEAADRPALEPLRPALVAEQAAYQALLKLRAREFEVVRGNNRQRSANSRASGASASQRQLNQLELRNDENRFEERSRARQEQLSPAEQAQRETRQAVSRLRELAQRQADLNERVKELQTALQAAKDESAKQEIERQLKRLREQEKEILRDTEELQERMEREENRDRMADARQRIEESRERVRQASQALEEGRLSQALTEGTRAGRQFEQVREDLRKQSSNEFTEELSEMRDQARELDERQDRLTEQLDAWRQQTRQSLRGPEDRKQVLQDLAEQQARLRDLVDRMRRTVTEAEETEPLLAKSLFDAVRKADAHKPDTALQQAEQLAEAGLAQEAARASRTAGQGTEELRAGGERAARSVLGDETAALRRARDEVEGLADEINRELARAGGQPRPPRPDQRPPGEEAQGQRGSDGNREAQEQRTDQRGSETNPQGPSANSGQPGAGNRQGTEQAPRGERNGQRGRRNQAGEQGEEPQPGPGQQQGRGQQQAQGEQPAEGEGQQPGQEQQQGQGQQPGQGRGEQQGESQQQGGGQQGGQAGERRGGSLRGNDQERAGGQNGGQGNRQRGGNQAGGLEQWLQGPSTGPGGPITGEGFRQWSDRMRDVEELLDDPDLRAEAARIRDRVRGAREEFRRHSKEPDPGKLKTMVADPIEELRDRIAEEVRRREEPASLVPIDRDPVPPSFTESVRRYYERLGSGK